MTFIVENGTGVKGATSYATVEQFRAYHSDRNTPNTGSGDLGTSAVQAALIAASDYIDTRWKFKGQRRFNKLSSRVNLTVPQQPVDGATITFDGSTVTFRDNPSAPLEVEIGQTIQESLTNAAFGLGQSPAGTTTFLGFEFADPDATIITLFGTYDGIPVTSTLPGSTLDNPETAGASAVRQPLEFPRVNLYYPDGQPAPVLPVEIVEATLEYAARAATAALAPDPTVDPSGGQVTAQRTKVGPIENETRFAENSVPRITRDYPAADRLLRDFVLPAGGVRRH